MERVKGIEPSCQWSKVVASGDGAEDVNAVRDLPLLSRSRFATE